MVGTTSAAALPFDDASLVARSLAGNRDAFGGIVSRYQSLICSVAFSATGSISRSEDLAQETFLTAWKDLRSLREPKQLRPWLCGIARNLVHNARRREGRDPSAIAEPIESAADAPAEHPLPTEQAISKEEEAILWRSMERIPEAYREPMVLFYRETQSVERVAAALGLSEDLVRQRLSRGRKLLQEQVLAFVEGALARSAPGADFTLGVVAALPGFSASALAATVATTAAKGSLVAKAAGVLAVFTAFTGLATSLVSGYASARANLNVMRTSQERAVFFRQLKVMAIGGFLLVAALLGLVLPRRFWSAHPLTVVFIGVLVSLAYGVWLVVMLSRYTHETRLVRAEAQRGKPELFLQGTGGSGALEYRSAATFLGLPLVHVRYAPPQQNAGPAVGWIAIGDRAVGVLFALGAMAAGGISVGSVSVGGIAVGGVSVGLVSLGGVAFGLLALGSLSLGLLSFGAFSLGWTSALGAVAVARDSALGGLAVAQHANDDVAKAFAAQHHLVGLFYVLLAVVVVLSVGPAAFMAVWTGRRGGSSSNRGQP